MVTPRTTSRLHTVVQIGIPLLLTVVVLTVPAVILPVLDLPGSGALISMCGLSALAVTMSLGWRMGLLSTVGLTLAVPIVMLATERWWVACLVMGLATYAYGMSAERGWQRAFILIPITLGFAVSGDPPVAAVNLKDVVTAIAVTLTVCSLSVLVIHLLLKGHKHGGSNPIPRARARGYAVLLAVTTVFTTAIALIWQWGHAGGWLIMTPLIVLQPYLHDALAKSIRRALGTTVGFVIAFTLAIVVPNGWAIYAIATIFAIAATVAMERRWDYSIYAVFLTVTIVLWEGSSTSITQTDLTRLGATLAGIGLALCIMVAALPFYSRANRRATQANASTDSKQL